jgi:T5orf172 domain
MEATDDYGYIYCMSNEYMNVLKIGWTKGGPLFRAKQLFTTGVPCEFEVKFSKRVKNPQKIEKDIHDILRNKRLSPRREFFKVTEEEVKHIFYEIEGEWWDETNEDDNQNEYIETENALSPEHRISDNVIDNEMSEEDDEADAEEEQDPIVIFMKQQKKSLTEQKCNNIKKHLVLINGKIEELDKQRNQLYRQIRVLDESCTKMKRDAHDKACEENKEFQVKLDKLDKVLGLLGEKKLQPTIRKTAERIPSGEPTKKKTSTFFSRKPLNEMVNQNTRFIYEQKKGVVFERFCMISKIDNRVYECDANGTRNGQVYRSLNDFCVMVKKSVNYHGSLKQDVSVVLKYYDIASQQYKSFRDLNAPLN